MKIAALGSLVAAFAAQPSSPSPIVAIRGATIVAATGAPPVADGLVVIRGDRIADVGAAATTEIPQGARIIEARGQYIIPGLIEMHAHMSKARASALGLMVANGVTMIRDLGGDHQELLRWRRDVNEGRRVGPRMLTAGPYLEAASNIERMRKDPPEQRVEPFDRIRIPIGAPEDAARVVKKLAASELDFLKIRTVQDRATFLAINRAAAEHGLKVMGHPPALTPDEILDAGQDDIEHGFIPRPGDPPREVRMGKRGAVMRAPEFRSSRR